jgi:hypothetical protein
MSSVLCLLIPILAGCPIDRAEILPPMRHEPFHCASYNPKCVDLSPYGEISIVDISGGSCHVTIDSTKPGGGMNIDGLENPSCCNITVGLGTFVGETGNPVSIRMEPYEPCDDGPPES